MKKFSNSAELNRSSFYRRILYICYGIRNEGKIEFGDLPTASEIAEKMVTADNFGFALMNISKYSNDREDGAKADRKLIERFLDDSNLGVRNFVREEIALMDPDLIITANLWDGKIDEKYLELIFSPIRKVNSIDDCADFYDLVVGKKIVQMIDLWHFSKPGSDQKLFYDPVMKWIFAERVAF